MSKRFFIIIPVCVILALVAIIGYGLPTSTPLLPVQEFPDRILLENVGGKVVFDHKKHYEDYNVSCEACHHERDKPTPIAMECGACHGVVSKPDFKTTHQAMYEDQLACVTCHHNQLIVDKEDPNKREVVETGKILREKGWVNLEADTISCSLCHEEKVEDLIPSRFDAFHESCMGCHEEQGKGPYKEDECAQCHT